MRVLVLSSVYPNRTRPTLGVFVRERIRHLAAHCEIVVVAPVPWFPFNRWIRGPEYAATPWVENQDGITVYHPRFLCTPLIGKCLDGLLCGVSLLPFVAWLRRRFPFELIDAHFSYPDGVAGVLMGKIFRCPTVVTLRGSHDLRHAKAALRRPQIRHALKAAAQVISVSGSLRQFAVDLGIDDKHIMVVPNGIDGSRFFPRDRNEARTKLGLPQDRTIVLSVGRLIEEKGQHRVIERLPELIAHRPHLLYVAIGEASGESYRLVLDDLVKRHELHDYVRIVPCCPHDEIPLWMAAADLFCLATRTEGWSNAITEALACGLPVVTTKVGGNAEVVRDGRDGLLVPFWDGEAFVAAVLRALGSSWDREEIAARARANGWEETARQVANTFKRSLAQDGRLPVSACVSKGAPVEERID